IIFFVGLIPHRQRGCSRITWGSESPCNFPPVSSIAVSCLLLQCEDIEIHYPDRIIPLEVWTTPIRDETDNISQAITAAIIEAMFKDCKTGGYNLEGSQANTQGLTNLILLIAIAYTA
ncbi:MAG: hypothetical protein F6K34_27415, partial [Okeania sp. SIO4D6]|nr:hypothetical protein [Okeania sp. SIO4D6]